MFLYDLGSLLGKCRPDLHGERPSTNQQPESPVQNDTDGRVPLNTAAVTESAGRCRLSIQQFAVLRETIKVNIVCCVCTDGKDCNSSICLCLCHMALSHHHGVASAHNTLHLSGSVNIPHISGGVEFAARIVVTFLRHC